MATDTIIVHGKEYDASELTVENYTAGHGEIDYHYNNQKRTGPVTEIVIHETVTCSSLGTVRVLEPKSPKNPGGRGLGIHFIADPDGTLYQHGDLADDFLWHATVHNSASIGVETVNPFDPKLLPKKDSPWSQVIDAPWAGGKYVVPTPDQAESVAGLIDWVTSDRDDKPPELQIPLVWHGLRGTKMSLGRVPGANVQKPGIYAHMYFDHGDGAWLVLYAWMRLVAGLSAEDAYAEAVKRATGAHNDGVDVSDLIPADSTDGVADASNSPAQVT